MTGERTLVFCKAPVPGRAKTRLAPALGPRAAARLQAELAERLLSQLPPETTDIWCHPHTRHAFFQGLRKQGYALYKQEGADLGERMQQALTATLARPEVAQAALVGVDCPEMGAAYINEAHRALKGCDLVLGPAEDGGYGLIGMKRPQPVFTGIDWGSSQALAQTCRLLDARQTDYRLLPTLWDLDRPEDYPRYLALTQPQRSRLEA